MDQNFEKMDGIVNKDYYKSVSPAPSSAATTIVPSILNVSTANTTPNGMDVSARASKNKINYIVQLMHYNHRALI